MRLVDGADPYEGRVEICLFGVWRTVCDDEWNNNAARATCRQLGYLTESMYFFDCHYISVSNMLSVCAVWMQMQQP